ncbi:MAG: WXG100 family type VII secretion target [Acholeplasmataceae bacterium]|jgi:WXG100 family type VII secretion target
MIQEISYEEVTTTAQNLHNSATNMKTILDSVKQKMQRVNTEETWKSNAAAEFLSKFNELASKFENFYTAVDNYSKFLQQTVETYKAADQAITGKVDELL